MRAVITVVGKDTVGILAKVAGKCSEYHINVIEVTQSILQDLFAMIMLVEIGESTVPFTTLVDEMTVRGQKNDLAIHCMHEDIFNAMHSI